MLFLVCFFCVQISLFPFFTQKPVVQFFCVGRPVLKTNVWFLSWLSDSIFYRQNLDFPAYPILSSNFAGLITSVTLLNSGIRARRRFDLSGVWCLLLSSINADVIRNLPGCFPVSWKLLSSVNLSPFLLDCVFGWLVKERTKSERLDCYCVRLIHCSKGLIEYLNSTARRLFDIALPYPFWASKYLYSPHLHRNRSSGFSVLVVWFLSWSSDSIFCRQKSDRLLIQFLQVLLIEEESVVCFSDTSSDFEKPFLRFFLQIHHPVICNNLDIHILFFRCFVIVCRETKAGSSRNSSTRQKSEAAKQKQQLKKAQKLQQLKQKIPEAAEAEIRQKPAETEAEKMQQLCRISASVEKKSHEFLK
ncbi:hypothetical protein M9H77_14215 [Catharanthus roseus]|uniref:Uncharacterized protein n=1 Tax=Catharanthus roseus TaxID=4058 RepID=A0ACC0BMI9_CATRO|nr:hypothetical protein M9H77_14215 [Catharanthus roseus]